MRQDVRRWCVTLVLLAGGCEQSVYGSASLYVYNGTEERATVTMSGGEEAEEFLLRPDSGRLFDAEIAGDRTFDIEFGDGERQAVIATLERETFNVLNIKGAGCFARADVSGMYVDGRNPVKVNETYEGENVISMRSEVHVPPGARLPRKKPKSPFGFNRLAVVPCEDLEDKYAVADFIKELR
ncbi:MAG: hypothetical protein AAFX94_24925 [Myxococcota bacterium]